MAGFVIQKKGTSPLLGGKTTLGDVKELLKELPTTPYDGKDDFEKLTRQKKAKGGSIKKDTHITKDGRVAKKGLYYYMNRAKKLGKSKPGKGTVSDKALKASAKTAKK